MICKVKQKWRISSEKNRLIKEIKKDVLIPFTLGTILGSSVGGSFFIQIDPWLLQLVVAIFILWSVFVFLLLANGLQYFFGIEATASVKNVLDGKPEVGIELSEESKDLLKKTLPRIGESNDSKEERKQQQQQQKKEVFYIKDNVYTYDEAKAVCKAHDAELADYNQMEKTYNEGGEWCGYGWSKNQMILFPTQKDTWNKLQTIDGHENDCGRPGINGGYIENDKAKFGVNCYGVKRSPTDYELAMLEQMKKQQYPSSAQDKEFKKNVNKFKEQVKDKQMVINPYNSSKWTS